MSAGDTPLLHRTPRPRRVDPLQLFFMAVCVAVPERLVFPFDIPAPAKHAMAISSFMILAWMTNVMEYGAAG